MAFPIVVTEALLDRASHTASSYLPSRTSWIPQVECNRSLVVAAYCTGLLVAQVYRVLAMVFQPGLSRKVVLH